MTAPKESSNRSTVAEQKTPTSTPQSPGTMAPAHQCRNCRASFCQPLGCGHVYCNECLNPRLNLAPGMTGCPECDRKAAPPTAPKQVTPEPKLERGHDYGYLDEQIARQNTKLWWIAFWLGVAVLGDLIFIVAIAVSLARGTHLFN